MLSFLLFLAMAVSKATTLMGVHMNMGSMWRFCEHTIFHGEENITGAVQKIPVVRDDDMRM